MALPTTWPEVMDEITDLAEVISEQGSNGQVLLKGSTDGSISWGAGGTGGSGESNIATNIGTDGVGVYDSKVGIDLRFRHIAPASNKVTVTLNAQDIDIDVAEANLTITESQISDLGSYLTAETNDLSTVVTWANVPDANITESSVTQHEAALTITESQIFDLGSYLTAETNDLTAAVTWANVPDANITESSVTQHEAALAILESQVSGNIPVSRLNSGTGATSATFWRGDGSWGLAGTAFISSDQFDDTDATYYFYGGDDPAGDWKINRYNKTTFAKTSADQTGNGGYATLAAAWPDRLTLSYS